MSAHPDYSEPDESPQGDSVDELLQEEPYTLPMAPVAVVVEGNVRTRPIPARDWVSKQWTVPAGRSQQIASDDPRRSALDVWVEVGPIVYIGTSQADVQAMTCASLGPTSETRLPMKHSREVWVYNADTSADAVVNAVSEFWAD